MKLWALAMMAVSLASRNRPMSSLSVTRRMRKDAMLYTQPMPRAVYTPRSTRFRSFAPIFWLA